ncbi:type 2 isopentenyl-diphosphate Delta-isomerase [Salipaludibacillus aurantiacus]|uniref:Isopentenyl-diphosphate delta-isomerase n=1 Tax=Salipaludibacillus aurantiacus TaxID=1601833 RepID=A0A1H9PAS8_9BACI|nr:type 2 isopentenyl-diphosphate Delta-isomerase [Salipaludibacillus aurantiacus]SER44879.1 isopentenyl-diphosphate delta-isomerase [Salipaludibacillus aurantiacus]
MSRAKRKLDHIEHALETGQSRASGFDDIQFIHRTFPDISVEEVSLSTDIGGLNLSSPIFINAMTGGGGKDTEVINRQLAQISNAFNIPMAVGSQMSALKDKNEMDSYKVVRQYHPKGLVFANVGSEATTDQAKLCVNMLEADALQIHMNVIQELVMPEGDRDFTGALTRIEQIVKSSEVPVIVKEVGFGMSRETVYQLKEIGVNFVDIGGFGGTNFSLIENARRTRRMAFFDQWGIPTAAAIAEAKAVSGPVHVLATGGIQNAFDISKALALGAEAAGMAGRVLKWLNEEGEEQTIQQINDLLEDLTMIMAALGARNIKELQKVPFILTGEIKNWLTERHIDTALFANRHI